MTGGDNPGSGSDLEITHRGTAPHSRARSFREAVVPWSGGLGGLCSMAVAVAVR